MQSQISAIDQDADGFLWFATEAGLCRFDGVRFRRFTRTEGLPDSVMVDVCAHGDEVWAATERGGLVLWNGSALEKVAGLPLEPGELLTGVQVLCRRHRDRELTTRGFRRPTRLMATNFARGGVGDPRRRG